MPPGIYITMSCTPRPRGYRRLSLSYRPYIHDYNHFQQNLPRWVQNRDPRDVIMAFLIVLDPIASIFTALRSA